MKMFESNHVWFAGGGICLESSSCGSTIVCSSSFGLFSTTWLATFLLQQAKKDLFFIGSGDFIIGLGCGIGIDLRGDTTPMN